MTLQIEPAARSETADVFTVLDEAATFLHAIGVSEQWPVSFSADPGWVGLVSQLVAKEQVFLARLDGLSVGAFYLGDGAELAAQDHHVWDGVPGDALYIGLLAVRRSVAGAGVAAAMLQWACSRAVASGRVLRLDCWAGNARLKQYYAEAGFEPRGEVEVHSFDGRIYSVSRFERRD